MSFQTSRFWLLFLAIACSGAPRHEAQRPAAPQAPGAVPVAVDPPAARGLPYPATREDDVIDDYHGTSVRDPYRWLENPDAEDTKDWVRAQNELTEGWLSRLLEREGFRARLTELWNYERYSPPFVEGRAAVRRTFFEKNDGLQNQDVLYELDPKGAPPRVFLDPNALSPDGTVALAGTAFSDDGSKMAYALARAGSDWLEWRVKEVASGQDLPDVVHWSKFSRASFTKDGRGFFYSRYPEPAEKEAFQAANYFHKVYYHRLGTPQSADELVFEDSEHKTRSFGATVSEDGRYLILDVREGTDRRRRLYYKELGRARTPVKKLFDEFDAAYAFVGNRGSEFFVVTDLGAPRSRLVSVNVARTRAGEKPVLRDIVPEHPTNKLASANLLGGGVLVRWLENAHDVVEFYDLAGKKRFDLGLPGLGSVRGFRGRSQDKEVYYAFTSFTSPGSVFKLNLTTGASTPFRQPVLRFQPEDYETRQEFYVSKDGTRIPMFIVHKKDLVRDGTHPTFLYAYGGFNIPLTPMFDPKLIAWLERGGIYAQPSLRGGGEFGEAWHQAGMLKNKQNVFDDFAAAAEHLIREKYTTAERLAIGGASNGGLLVGASITQRPELFGAAMARVGVMDMLRYHEFTIGHAWISEYGASSDPEMFPVLLRYSPLHNVRPNVRYPATLLLTADHDDRVVPGHSFKFAATLQKAQAGSDPILIRIDTRAGHGAGKPTTKLIAEAADTWAFLLANVGG